MRRTVSPLEAVMDRVRVTDDGCWEWQLAKTWYGYGRWNLDGKVGSAHRISYELLTGPIPEGLELDHVCRNRACVNPAHLEPVTHIENVRRGSQAQKTHCKHGHEFTDENTYVSGRGHRACRACRRAYHHQHKPPPMDRTQCKHGHPRTPEHGHVDTRGYWRCLVCARTRARDAKRAKGATPRAERRAAITHCPHGHEYTPENSYIAPDGKKRYCRECNRAAARKRAA